MNREKLLALLPEISQIHSEELQNQTIDALLFAIEKGRWNEQSLKLAPVSVSRKNCDVGLIEHIRDVVSVCMANYHIVSKYYKRHGIRFDWDIVICGALLHDLGKFVEFTIKDQKPTYSDNYPLMRHPLSGAIIAAQKGLPDDIVHLIATHSFEGDKSYHTAESEFVRKVDMFVFECSVRGLQS